MKIGILSDPHTRTQLQREALKMLSREGVDYLLHAGDFVVRENIDSLAESGIPYAGVLGNNDNTLASYASAYRIGREPYYLALGGVKVKLMHMPYYMTPDTDLIIYGHTHRFEAGIENGTLYINPGEICAREKSRSECAIATLNDGEWEVEYLYTAPSPSPDWKREKIPLYG
jgi:putative phosphoesterase